MRPDGALTRARQTRQPWRLAAAVVSLGLVPWLTACERKAPGPDECRSAALHLLGITEQDRLRDARAFAAVDQLMVECLTTPFDRELTRCLEERGGRVCVEELRRRLKAPVAKDPTGLY